MHCAGRVGSVRLDAYVRTRLASLGDARGRAVVRPSCWRSVQQGNKAPAVIVVLMPCMNNEQAIRSRTGHYYALISEPVQHKTSSTYNSKRKWLHQSIRTLMLPQFIEGLERFKVSWQYRIPHVCDRYALWTVHFSSVERRLDERPSFYPSVLRMHFGRRSVLIHPVDREIRAPLSEPRGQEMPLWLRVSPRHGARFAAGALSRRALPEAAVPALQAATGDAPIAPGRFMRHTL